MSLFKVINNFSKHLKKKGGVVLTSVFVFIVSLMLIASPLQALSDFYDSSEIQFYDPSSCPSDSSSGSSTGGKTVVIDPGHGPNKTTTDGKTGLSMVESNNQPEGHDVWEVAQKIKNDLSGEGYNIILTKKSEDDNVTFRQRAEVADNNHAALALSIHGDSGLPDQGEIFVQKVGLYRGSGSNKTVFSDAGVAQKSQQYAQTFKKEREKVESGSVVIKDNSFSGRVGLEPGNIPMVQLFSKTPWVYNEEKMPFNKNTYAKGLENSIKKVLGSSASSSSSDSCCSSGATTLTGKDAVEKTFNFFVGKGLSPAQSAGVTANFMWETGGGTTIDPLTSGSDPNVGVWGIAQWTPGSKYVQDKQQIGITGSDADLSTQLQVVWAEMNGKGSYFSNVVDGLKKIDNAGDAADYFRANFEGCDTSNASCTTKRVETAKEVLNQYGSGSPTSGGSGSSCSSLTGDGSAEAAAQAAKKLSDYQIPYSQACRTLKKTPPACGYDCSASVSWVLLTAGFTLPGNASWGDWAPVSGDFENWGDPGEGSQMTVWANADHVFIEFKVPGVGHYQLNTSYGSANGLSSGDGPQFFPWGQNGEADANGSSFTARHWPGT